MKILKKYIKEILLNEFRDFTITEEEETQLSKKDQELWDRAAGYIFYEKLTDNEDEVIGNNLIKVSKAALSRGSLTDCGLVCDLWRKIFKKNNIEHRIVSGDYWEASDEEREFDSPPGSAEHVWIEFPGGRIFDPTAIQFGHNIDKKYYNEDSYDDAGDPTSTAKDAFLLSLEEIPDYWKKAHERVKKGDDLVDIISWIEEEIIDVYDSSLSPEALENIWKLIENELT
jgi:hypothetical protein